jgi:hypothetical protein
MKRKPAKKTAKKTVKKTKGLLTVHKTPISEITPDQQIVGAVFLGKIRDFFTKLSAATVILEAPLSVGETIRIKGHTTDLTQKVEHLEVDHRSVPSAAAGEGVGIMLADKARIGDAVYKL